MRIQQFTEGYVGCRSRFGPTAFSCDLTPVNVSLPIALTLMVHIDAAMKAALDKRIQQFAEG
jgi:hypothetical protein